MTGMDSARRAQRNEGYKNVIKSKTKKKPVRAAHGTAAGRYYNAFQVKMVWMSPVLTDGSNTGK